VQTRIWPLAVRKINGIGPSRRPSCTACTCTPSATSRRSRANGWSTTSARPTAPGCTTRLGPRRPAGGHRERAGVHEPRDDLRARPARRARPRGARARSSPTCAPAWPRTCSARATWAAPSASSCATTTSAPPRATSTLDHFTADAATIRRAPASASNASTWRSACACWACAWASWRGRRAADTGVARPRRHGRGAHAGPVPGRHGPGCRLTPEYAQG
jgi:hypothetical protein